jgi:HrpA-like RNA helicase
LHLSLLLEPALICLSFQSTKSFHITELGRSMSAFPLSPCFSKMLSLSAQHGLMEYAIAMVAALTVQEVLMETPVGQAEGAFDR